MDKLVKISIIIGVLLAGFGIFYHYVIYLPDLEKQRVAREQAERDAASRRAEAEQREAEMRKSRRELAYYDCLSRAEKNYVANWANACKSHAQYRSVELKKCLSSGLGEGFCQRTWGGADQGPNCSLPNHLADSTNKILDKAKQQCLAEAKLF